MSTSKSYAEAIKITRNRAGNFWKGIRLLPSEKRAAMASVYAYARLLDDIADGPFSQEEKERRLEETRQLLENSSTDSFWPALAETEARFSIPRKYFLGLHKGVRMDLSKNRYATFEELSGYCWHVASCVGLICLHIFEFEDRAAIQEAEKCGLAFQMTNILRDILEDFKRGRIYLPAEDLHRFGVSEQQFAQQRFDENFLRLMEFEIERTKGFYRAAMPLFERINRKSRPALGVMMAIYFGILKKLAKQGLNPFDGRVRLSGAEKFFRSIGAWVRVKTKGRITFRDLS